MTDGFGGDAVDDVGGEPGAVAWRRSGEEAKRGERAFVVEGLHGHTEGNAMLCGARWEILGYCAVGCADGRPKLQCMASSGDGPAASSAPRSWACAAWDQALGGGHCEDAGQATDQSGEKAFGERFGLRR